MNLPSHIRDLLQTNYFVPAEELDKPLDEMSPQVRDLILVKCMNGKDFISESETADVANAQVMEDISSDVSADLSAQVDRFVQNRAAIEALMLQSVKKSTDHSGFDRAADILAAKRMASDEYANAPKTEETFRHAKESVKKELNIKYWTTRYYDAHPAASASDQAKTVEDIAEIAKMIYADETDKIAGRFNLSDTKQARESAKAATLSFAMADALSFSDKIKAKIKDSAFVRRVEGLNEKFRQNYPKTYIASKIAANGAGALVLGPVFSAFKAASTVSAMRKDYAKYKKEHNEKGSVWKFLRTPEGRQKLMTFGQNTLRVIPGVRAAGIALGAVKNSDSLLSSIKEIKENGGSKKAWLKVGACTVGLLAVATTAAYANDEVAEAVNSFVHNHLSNAVEKVYDAASSLTGDTHTTTQFPDGFHEMHIHSDGSVDMNGVFNHLPDSTKSGLTLEHLGYNTAGKYESIVLTDNKSGISLTGTRYGSSYGIGLVKDNSNRIKLSSSMGLSGQATNIKIADGVSIQNVNFDAGVNNSVHAAVRAGDDEPYLVGVTESGVKASHNITGGSITAQATKSGTGIYGSFNRLPADTDKGVTITHAHVDTLADKAGVGVTDNKSGLTYSAAVDGKTVSAGIIKNDSNRIKLSSSMGLSGQATNIKIADGVSIQNVNFDAGVNNSVHAAIRAGDDEPYLVGVTESGVKASHNLPGGSATIKIGKDGTVSGNIATNISSNKPETGKGFRLTRVEADTDGKGAVFLKNGKTGRDIKISADTHGNAAVSFDGKNGNATTVSVDRSGDVSISKTGGKKVNISRLIRDIKKFVR